MCHFTRSLMFAVHLTIHSSITKTISWDGTSTVLYGQICIVSYIFLFLFCIMQAYYQHLNGRRHKFLRTAYQAKINAMVGLLRSNSQVSKVSYTQGLFGCKSHSTTSIYIFDVTLCCWIPINTWLVLQVILTYCI